tara:strand:+ start:2913 stop:3359 length:447 start_codon:yes stop_codon:yes gene_type:complete
MKELIKEFWKISEEFESSDIKKSFVNNLHIDNDEVGSFMLDVLEKEIDKTTNEDFLIKIEKLQGEIIKYEKFPYEKDLVRLLSKITLLARDINTAGKWLNQAELPIDLKDKMDEAFAGLFEVFSNIGREISLTLDEQETVHREGYMHG